MMVLRGRAMLRYILLLVLISCTVILSALVVETGSLKGFLYGSEPACAYDNWVSHLAERIVSPGYNVYAPWDRQTQGFGDFNIPTTTQLNDWGIVIDEFLLHNWDNAVLLIETFGFPYQIVQFNDTDTGRVYYMLRETLIDAYDDNGTPDPYDDEIGAFGWGWGLYIYNPNGDQRTIITIPHPCDDFMTPPLGHYALVSLNAQYLMIAGAGREVAWTGIPPYTNTKSLSDPTRVTNHPWYPAYTKFCNKIRTETGQREFSLQLHSYDTDLHPGFASVQISAGFNKMCPNLPIRDLSRFRNDLINFSNPLIIPANTIGIHNNVYVNDYYTVQYSIHPFLYSDGEVAFPVNNYLDLPAYSQNTQMNYTLNGWTDYDTFEPFFHAEMDELPDCFTQNENTYKWFWGWNAQTQRWDMNNLYDKAIQYYSIWIDNLSQVLPATLVMNDGHSPLPPSDLTVFNQSYNSITLRWQKADDFDFDTYQILYSTQPFGTGTFSIFSRTNNSFLASPHCEQIDVTGLATNTQYYFVIRAKDKNGNYSPISNEVTGTTVPAQISNFRGIGQDWQVLVKWNVSNQSGNLGFKIYRSDTVTDFTLLDSYETNPDLLSGNSNYSWIDYNVSNNLVYIYKISCTGSNSTEFFHNLTSTCYPRNYYTLYLSTDGDALIDSLTFSANPNASSSNDSDYDIVKASAPNSNYVYAAFWEQYWGSSGTYLQQEVHADFDPTSTFRTWVIRARSDQLNIPLTFRVDETYGRYSEKLYLRDSSNGFMTNLAVENYTFTVQNTNNRTFTLYWGNLQPTVSISNLANRIYQGGTTQAFYWSSNFSFLVDHYDISIQNETDSILVAQNLDAYATMFSYTFPSNTTIHNARLIVDAWSTDGQRIRQISGFRLGIVPAVTFATPQTGLMMQANVWPYSTLNIPDVYGANSLGWTFDTSGNWWQINPFIFGFGYWVNKINPFEFSTPLPIQRDSISIDLRRGWNIVPNPHLCSYNIKDLRFRINNNIYTFAEALAQGFISRGIYVYREARYIETTMIYPHESFLIKYYGPAQFQPKVNFVPYYSGPEILPQNSEWQLRISAQQDSSDIDDFYIGCHILATDNYDFKYDLPEPPAKPLPNLTRLYLYRSHNDSLFIDLHLNSELRAPFSINPDQEKIWNFRLEAGNDSPVNFTIDSSQFPESYGASIHIEDFAYNIQHGNTFSFSPSQAGTITGQIRVQNYFTGVNESTIPIVSNIRVYPNPFNPQTNIAFGLNKAGKVSVEIFNVKGQLVTNLHNGHLNTGTHQLTWNGKDKNNKASASGLYFTRIRTADKTYIVKMMLLK